MSVLIYTDADNTLWDTNAVYESAQLQLLEDIEGLTGRSAPPGNRLQYLRTYDQAIAKSHHAHLRYPPALLIQALAMGLRGEQPNEAASKVLSQGALLVEGETLARETFERNLDRLPPLLPGVQKGLALAGKSGIPVFVVTEGAPERAKGRLNDLHIEQYTTGVLSATKTRELYVRLGTRAAPRHAVMIGDQPDRDIRPAHEAGLTTILVAGNFRPEWTSRTEIQEADHVASDFGTAMEWVVRRHLKQVG